MRALSGTTKRVRLFEADPELLRRTPAALRERLAHRVSAPLVSLDRGPWDPEATCPAAGAVLFVLLDGLLTRETRAYDRSAVELVGPGDPFHPFEEASASSVRYRVSWSARAPSRLVRLDTAFMAALVRVPGTLGVFLDRRRDRADRLAVQASITRLPRLDLRILAMLWHLADRWGRARHEGITLELALDRQLLADLVGAERSSVSRRLGELRARGLLSRGPAKRLTLHGGAPRSLEELEAAVRLGPTALRVC